MTTVVAVLCGAVSGYLILRPPPRPVQAGPRHRPRGLTRWSAVTIAAVAGALVTLLDGPVLVLGLILLGCAAGVAQLVVRARRLREQMATRRRVVEAAEVLVGELRAGQPPVAALQHCVEVWPALGPVAAAARLGADVPSAMTRLGARPGAEGLCDLASAWRVSERSGAGLTRALTQVVESARTRLATAQLVRAELSSAQATARLVAALPLVTISMAAGTGADPWAFLTTSAAGLGCLASAAVLVFVGLWWIDRIAVAVVRR
jgi:tight adherence protein B